MCWKPSRNWRKRVWVTTHSKPASFYDLFERKGGDLETTHYCPGCGHGVLHKLLAEAITDLGIQDRTILVNPVGCSVFAYYYFDVGNIQGSHGRAPAIATGVKRARPDSVVLCYQGDGDLAAIGGNEILHAANRGENITVFFVNNGIYGMTGGQMAPTTPLGMRTTTSPRGRTGKVEGYPLRMCELLASLEAPAYIERVALTGPKQHMRARKAVRQALQTQIDGKGFSFVEVLAACPTNWKLSPPEAVKWVDETMLSVFPLGVYRDRKEGGYSVPASVAARMTAAPSEVSDPGGEELLPGGAVARGELPPVAMKISGFGGQGILFAGIALAEAGMREGLQVSWIPSYGPEMRGGTAHCHVRLSPEAIASPLINRPSTVLVFNEPSLEKFESELLPGGLLVLNASMVKRNPERTDIKVLRVPATEAANRIGNPRVGNMVILGAYLEESRALNPESILRSLSEHGMRPELLEINRQALMAGRDLVSGS
jgi:2-oxoisovalerate ferredoxin oxidoreductase beta subunit